MSTSCKKYSLGSGQCSCEFMGIGCAYEPESQQAPDTPVAPKCTLCNDTGSYCVGTSGRDDDGNAPEFEHCDCDADPLPAAPAPTACQHCHDRKMILQGSGEDAPCFHCSTEQAGELPPLPEIAARFYLTEATSQSPFRKEAFSIEKAHMPKWDGVRPFHKPDLEFITVAQAEAYGKACALAARQAPTETAAWQSVTRSGQVKVGDKLRFKIGDTDYKQSAKQILHAGTDIEEVIYDKGRNFYFITSMVIGGRSNHKGVEVLARPVPAPSLAQGAGSIDSERFRELLTRVCGAYGMLDVFEIEVAELVAYIGYWHRARLARTASPSQRPANIDKAVKRALTYQTLEEALSFICTWENERAVDQAVNRPGTGSGDHSWDTLFLYLIKEVMKAWAARTAAPSELRNAFMTLESAGNSEGRTIVLKFNHRDDAYAVHDFLLKVPVKEWTAPAPSEGQAIPRVLGVGRDAESPGQKGVLVAFERRLTDDELRTFHAALVKKGGAA